MYGARDVDVVYEMHAWDLIYVVFRDKLKNKYCN